MFTTLDRTNIVAVGGNPRYCYITVDKIVLLFYRKLKKNKLNRVATVLEIRKKSGKSGADRHTFLGHTLLSWFFKEI